MLPLSGSSILPKALEIDPKREQRQDEKEKERRDKKSLAHRLTMPNHPPDVIYDGMFLMMHR